MSGKVAFPLDGSGGMLDATPYPKDTSTIRQKPMQVLCLGLSRTGTMCTLRSGSPVRPLFAYKL